jgi:hypothetical protein
MGRGREALYLDLPRDPTAFEVVPGTDLLMAYLACFPPLTVYFSIDHSTSTITLEEIIEI